jgi:hypothetical protein
MTMISDWHNGTSGEIERKSIIYLLVGMMSRASLRSIREWSQKIHNARVSGIIQHSMDNPLVDSTNLKSIPPCLR